MPEDVSDKKDRNRLIAVLRQRVGHLDRQLTRLKGQQKTDSVALGMLRKRHPKEYWDVVNGLREEYAKAGRMVSGEQDSKGKAYSRVLERDGYRCVRCGVFGIIIGAEDRIQKVTLSVDHIHEKADGGSSSPDNLQTLCNSCHRIKTALSSRLRSYVDIDRIKAEIINSRFIESYERSESKGAVRSALIAQFGAKS